jgi:hypothetical protein
MEITHLHGGPASSIAKHLETSGYGVTHCHTCSKFAVQLLYDEVILTASRESLQPEKGIASA